MLTRLALCLVFGAVSAPLPAQVLEARNAGMGGTAVASSRYLSAGFFNPALLAAGEEDKDDDFGLILPAIGVYGSNVGVIEDVDDYQNSIDNLGMALDDGSVTPEDRDAALDLLGGLADQTIFAKAAVGMAISVPSDTLGVSLFIASRLEAQGVTLVDAGDAGIIESADSSTDLGNLSSTARVIGVNVSEVGLALAHGFDIGGTELGVGLTPKYQRIDTFDYEDLLTTIDFDDADDERYRNDSSDFNLDAGLSWAPSENWMIAIAGRDLIAREVQTTSTTGAPLTYLLDPLVTVGGAYRGETLTLAIDFDLTKTQRFEGIDDQSQFLRLGGEIDVADWLQLRAGYQHDLEDTLPATITAGLGISPFDILHLDIAGMIGDDDTGGVAAQLALTF